MDDLKYLKKHYGENFSHLCRSLFPTLLEHEGLLSKVISEHFAPSRSLYDDILPLQDEFKTFVYSFVDVEQEEPQKRVIKTPEQLMDEAGYILYPECQTEDDVQAFKKYWAKGEELCTFWGGRLDRCRVWFAVKKNVEEIRREDFKSPKRQDEYGTSAISIQFSKGENSTLSIKNRYNHTVNYPDSTFSNNLDNIIEGLTESFVETYGISLMKPGKRSFEIPSYRLGDDGKFYKVNLEFFDNCYSENNIVLEHGRVVQYDPARYILAENYLIDKQKNIVTCLSTRSRCDAFTETLGEIKSISTKTDKDGNRVVVFTPEEGEDVEMTLNGANQIVGYSNPNVTTIGDGFLEFNKSLKDISLPKVTTIGNEFLCNNDAMTALSLPKVEKIGNGFLFYNEDLNSISLPNVQTIRNDFLCRNRALTTLSLPKVETIEKYFLRMNNALTALSLPNVKTIGTYFMSENETLTTLSLPKVEKIEDYFLFYNEVLNSISLPNVETIGGCFLVYNQGLQTLSLPKVTKVGYSFVSHNKGLSTLSLPNVKTIENYFLTRNEALASLSLPNVESIGHDFLSNNKALTSLCLPNVETIGHSFLSNNKALTSLCLPKVEIMGFDFLTRNSSITTLSLPKAIAIDDGFMFFNDSLTSISLPNVETIEKDFLHFNNSLTALSLPKAKKVDFKGFLECSKKFKKLYAPNVKKSDLPLRLKSAFTKQPIEEDKGKEE